MSQADASERGKTSGGRGSGAGPRTKGRIAAVVGLSLLEVIRARDLPTEILASEDPSQTMPRRLGLSGVVDLQIRMYREQVRHRQKMTDEQARDLFHLVMRRPDSEEVFFQAGELLAGKARPLRAFERFYPQTARYLLARRQVQKVLRGLFGRSIGGFARGPFTLEAQSHFFIQMDPGGDACYMLTGLAGTILGRYLRRPVELVHSACQARKRELCRWVATEALPRER